MAQGVTAVADEMAALLEKLDAALQADAVLDSQEASAQARAAVQRALAGKGKGKAAK